MALPRGTVRSFDENQQVKVWKRRIIIIVGFTACIIGIMMNLKIAKSKRYTYFEETIRARMLMQFEEPIVACTDVWDHIPVEIPTQNCQFASKEGPNPYPEDQITCNLHLKIPFFAHDGLEEVKVGAVAVFDGHNGMEASVMASRLFLDKFLLKLNYSTTEQSSNYMELLKSSLVQTIKDIDAEFSKLAYEYGSQSGSTAVVALIYNNHVLVANVGNSKAFLCSRDMQSDEAGEGVVSGLSAKELTRDHNANRLDERARVEASGGVFTFLGERFPPLLWGRYRVTRAIGHVSLKSFGIIASPEVTDWLPLISKDEFLVVSSDGMFTSLTTQEVCDFLNKAEDHSDPSLLAQQLIQKGSLHGNRESLSVVLVPLRSGELTV